MSRIRGETGHCRIIARRTNSTVSLDPSTILQRGQEFKLSIAIEAGSYDSSQPACGATSGVVGLVAAKMFFEQAGDQVAEAWDVIGLAQAGRTVHGDEGVFDGPSGHSGRPEQSRVPKAWSVGP